MSDDRIDARALIDPVEARLRSGARDAAWPETPDLAASLARRLEGPGSPDLRPAVLARIGGAGGSAPARRPAPRLGFAVAAALAAVLALAGIAGALGIRLPGFELLRVAETPPAGHGLPLGSPVPLADVLAGPGPEVRVPAALPAPDTAYVLGAGDRAIVTLAWRAGAGEPSLPGTDLALTVMALRGRTDDTLIGKVVGPGTTVDAVRVGADRGWWIAGAPHEVFVERPDGRMGPLAAAVAGDTLVFVRDGTLYRLESALGRDRTLEIAASMP